MAVNGLLNRSSVKKFALDYAAEHKYHKYSQVSAEFLDRVSRHLKCWIEEAVDRQPSKGKTIR